MYVTRRYKMDNYIGGERERERGKKKTEEIEA